MIDVAWFRGARHWVTLEENNYSVTACNRSVDRNRVEQARPEDLTCKKCIKAYYGTS